MSNITMTLKTDNKNPNQSQSQWWDVKERMLGKIYSPGGVETEQPFLSMITFNEKKAPASISKVTGYG